MRPIAASSDVDAFLASLMRPSEAKSTHARNAEDALAVAMYMAKKGFKISHHLRTMSTNLVDAYLANGNLAVEEAQQMRNAFKRNCSNQLSRLPGSGMTMGED